MTPWWYFKTVTGIAKLTSQPFLSLREANDAIEHLRLDIRRPVRVQILEAKQAPEVDKIVRDEEISPENHQ
jgi:hypothetical protein